MPSAFEVLARAVMTGTESSELGESMAQAPGRA
jgi:hypothetical protein